MKKRKAEEDFNHIQRWLDPLLKKRGMSAEKLARHCDLSRASIYFYRADVTRPTEQAMLRICRALGVPFEEGLAQYTPKRVGRPPRS